MNATPPSPAPAPPSFVDLHLAGDFKGAEAACRQALLANPDDESALSVLVMVQLQQRRFSEAEPVIEHMIRLWPDEPAHWLNLGAARTGAGRPDDALPAFARAAALGEDSALLHYHLGLAHLARQDLESARAVLARGIQLDPEDAEMRMHYAQACYEAARHDDAVEALSAWPTGESTPPEVAATVGNLLMNLGKSERAEGVLRTAVARAPDDLRSQLALVQLYERNNRVEEATALLRAIVPHPRAELLGASLLMTRARLAQRNSQHELAVELLTQAMPDYKGKHERHSVLYPMAQSLDAMGRHDDAFAALLRAHASHVERVGRAAPMATARGTPNMIVTRFDCDPADVAAWDHAGAPDRGHSPVFVVAFPRSGTTLLELTLDAHPRLVSMDEQPFIQNALEEITALGVSYPNELAKIGAADLERIRANYWQRVAKLVTLAPGQRLVDKNPLNILRLPVLKRLFPDAPIILAIRHPMDIILSCYTQHFSAPDWALLCADLGALASGYRKTFDYWYRTVDMVKPSVLELRYEQLVGDFEGTMRGAMEFLGLPWDDALLRPAEHAKAKGFISTPSYSQVAQPVHKRAVGRWENYRTHLEPVIPEVRPYLERWGYEA